MNESKTCFPRPWVIILNLPFFTLAQKECEKDPKALAGQPARYPSSVEEPET
jgi:hypothetical protein